MFLLLYMMMIVVCSVFRFGTSIIFSLSAIGILFTIWIYIYPYHRPLHLSGIHYYNNKTKDPIRVHYFNRPPWVTLDAFAGCDYKCYMTEGHRDNDSGVVIFHAPYVSHIPPVKQPGQIWIFHSLEPPWLHNTDLKQWKRLFNWTISNRRDADILYTYSKFEKRKDSNVSREITMSEHSRSVDVWSTKTKDIAWMVSHCSTSGKRDDYVKILKSYTRVDIYGKCGSAVCSRDIMESCLRPYKFYLAFENALCIDYVTEKSFGRYTANETVIPVTRGTLNYSLFLPPGSYIDTANFRKISDLAVYIRNISRNTTILNDFMNWKKHYVLRETAKDVFCELCRRLHFAEEKYTRVYEDVDMWVHGHRSIREVCWEAEDLH